MRTQDTIDTHLAVQGSPALRGVFFAHDLLHRPVGRNQEQDVIAVLTQIGHAFSELLWRLAVAQAEHARTKDVI